MRSVSGKEVRIVPFSDRFAQSLLVYKCLVGYATKTSSECSNRKMKLEKTGTVALSTKWSNVPFRIFDEKDKPDMVILISKLNDD